MCIRVGFVMEKDYLLEGVYLLFGCFSFCRGRLVFERREEYFVFFLLGVEVLEDSY